MANRFCKPALTTGLDDGTSWANAWQTTQKALDSPTAGDHIFFQGGEVLTVRVDANTFAGTSGVITLYVAVNSDESVNPWDDVDGTLFTLDANSAVTSALQTVIAWSDFHFVNWEFINSTSIGGVNIASGINKTVFWGCSFNNNGGRGLDLGTGSLGTTLVQCCFNGNSGDGVEGMENGLVIFSEFISNGLKGVETLTNNAYTCFAFCVSHNNTTYGFHVGAYAFFIGCVIDGNSDGIYLDSLLYSGMFLNRITNNSGYGINGNGVGDSMMMGYNAFYNNTNGEADTAGHLIKNIGDANIDDTVSMSSDGYVDRATDNFNITDSAEFRRRALNVGSFSV